MNKSPAYQHYPDKATAGTQHLSPEAFKGYWLMLWWMWLHSPDHCSIPDDAGAWAIAMQTDKERAQYIMAEVMQDYMPMLKRTHGKLVSAGLEKEAEKQSAKRKQAQEAAKSRWPNNKQAKRTHSGRIDSASIPQCTPSTSPAPFPVSFPTSKKKKVCTSVKYTDQFLEFWNACPRKTGKQEAMRSFQYAVEIVTFDVLRLKMREYAKAMAGTDQCHIAMPSTWLNQHRWEDELSTPKNDPGYLEM